MVDFFLQVLQNKYVVLTTKILAGIAIVIGIYSFFKSDHANLKYEILLNERIIDVKEEIENLNVYYDSINVIRDNFQLSSVIVRVINDGNKSITNNLYDPKFLPGIEFENSKILSFDVTRASNKYLESAINPAQRNINSITINPVIIDIDEYFDLKFLLIHPDSIFAFPSALGKVADVSQIKIVEKFIENDSFLRNTFKGNFQIQLTRSIAYTLIFFGAFILLAGLISSPVEKIDQKKRVKRIKSFKEEYPNYSDRKYEALYKSYINNHEIDYLKNLVRETNLFQVISDSDEKEILIKLFGQIDKENSDYHLFSDLTNKSTIDEKINVLYNSQLFRVGVILIDPKKKSLKFDQELINVLNTLYLFVEK